MFASYDFPADTAVLSKIGELVVEAGKQAGFRELEIDYIQIAVIEVCTNTIIHGLNRDPKQSFRLEIEQRPGEIEFCIRESGVSYHPHEVRKPDRAAPLESRSVGGWGMHFVYELMDEVEFQTGEDGVKMFRLVKRRP